jgi:hypothetical protein
MTSSAPARPLRSIAARLSNVQTAEELHALLAELADTASSRWTRTQVLFYLPEPMHSLAAEYFAGERIVIPDRRPMQLSAPDPVAIDRAIDALRSTSGAAPVRDSNDAQEGNEFEIRPLDLLEADPPTDEDDVIGNVLAAILEEAKVVDREAPKRYRLSDGKCTGSHGENFVYVFSWSSEPDMFVPGELVIGKDRFAARVGRQSEGDRRFELITPDYHGPSIERAVFRVDPTFLLRASFETLKAKRAIFEENQLARALFSPPDVLERGVVRPAATSNLNALQREAVAVATVAQRSYVWGPPGTGKTTSLGQLIRELVGAGKRVLVLSPYNIAVDEAVLAARSRGSWAPEEIVRVGRISELVRKAGIDLDNLLERRAEASGLLDAVRTLHASVMQEYGEKDRPTPATVRKCLEELGAIQVSRGRKHDEASRKLAEAVKGIRAGFRAPEDNIITNAAVVGTTVALSYLLSAIGRRSFDHVIVDEASVLRVPEALIVALGAAGKLTFFGDPKQLPSIVRERSPSTERWLKPNPFALASIRTTADARGSCVMLKEQHRMAPPIRELISSLFYENSLQDGNCPSSGRLLLLDTSATPARCTTKWIRMSPSKENLVHRSIVAGLIGAIRERDSDSRILVLSPYAAQRRAYDAEAITNRATKVRFATVHTSQGTESEIVILDLVIAPGRGKSRFMNERTTPEFRNLMNVGMSRARRQLIIVGHAKYITQAYPNGLLHGILRHVRDRAEWVEVPASLRMKEVFEAATVGA